MDSGLANTKLFAMLLQVGATASPLLLVFSWSLAAFGRLSITTGEARWSGLEAKDRSCSAAGGPKALPTDFFGAASG